MNSIDSQRNSLDFSQYSSWAELSQARPEAGLRLAEGRSDTGRRWAGGQAKASDT